MTRAYRCKATLNYSLHSREYTPVVHVYSPMSSWPTVSVSEVAESVFRLLVQFGPATTQNVETMISNFGAEESVTNVVKALNRRVVWDTLNNGDPILMTATEANLRHLLSKKTSIGKCFVNICFSSNRRKSTIFTYPI